MRPRLLDLCCCQGGASKGYVDAGFDVVGVDLQPQPRYPFEFHQADVLNVLRACDPYPAVIGWRFAAIHASPPCQAHSGTQRIRQNNHPDLIAEMRDLLEATGLPYVIENVPGAPLRDPVELCGEMFGLRTYRHRWFETNWPLTVPLHPQHVAPQAKMGRPPKDGEYMHVVGNFSNVGLGREIMGMPWASRDGLREAIPPAYTEFVGAQLLEVVS